MRPGEESGAQYPFAIVCAIGTDYDLAAARGLGGQLAVQDPAVVNHHLRNYLRELGCRTTVGGTDALAMDVATGLGTLDQHGRLVPMIRKPYIHVVDVIITDLALAPDEPQPEGA